MRRSCLLVSVIAALTAPTGACRKSAAPPPTALIEVTSADEEGPISRDDLYAEWASGRFARLASVDISDKLDRHMSVDNEAGVSAEAIRSLTATLTAFLTAYASTDFDKYVAFRDPASMVGPDDPGLRRRIETLTQSWNPGWGDPPSDALDVMHFVWRMYIEGELAGIRRDPVIERVKWASCHTRIGFLPKEEVQPREWDQVTGTPSHFFRSLRATALAAALSSELDPAVPNRVSATELAERDGELVFADFEIVQKAGDGPPHPLLARFVYDRRAGKWLMLNAVKIENEPPNVFVW